MKFVFWQNIISIHQSAFIKALAITNGVVLISEEELDKERTKEQWNIPDMGKAKVVLNPDDSEMAKYFEDKNNFHIFSGMDAYPMVYKAFKIAVSKNANISVMAEPYDWRGIKGFLRRLKYSYLFARYGRYIQHFFTTGNHGVKVFHQAGLPLKKLHQWGYFTEDTIDLPIEENQKPKVIFVGKIDERKNIHSFVESVKQFEDKVDSVYIIGTGPNVKDLKESIIDMPKIHYLGILPNEEVKHFIRRSDLLVLPSLFDGWGAVVNEALQQGTRVLCSDMCGAEILLDGKIRGGSFSLANSDSLSLELNKWIDKGSLSLEQRKEIQNWAKDNISGEKAAEYFTNIIQNKDIKAPWLTKLK